MCTWTHYCAAGKRTPAASMLRLQKLQSGALHARASGLYRYSDKVSLARVPLTTWNDQVLE